jgi:hypothetical protein
MPHHVVENCARGEKSTKMFYSWWNAGVIIAALNGEGWRCR